MEPEIPNNFQYDYNKSQIPKNRRKPTKRRPHPSSERKTRNMETTRVNTGKTVRAVRTTQRRLNKRKLITTLVIFLVIIMLVVKIIKKDEKIETASNDDITQSNITGENSKDQEQNKDQNQDQEQAPVVKREITDWNLRLANSENILPDDFEIELANIDKTRQFDARAIKYLNQMMNDMRKDKIANVWVQSAYRSVPRQKELYNNSVNKYLKQGKSQEEAEMLTDKFIAKPGSSDHNLGLAVDFNSVDNKFEDLAAFKWLQKNAENYGFVLRFPKDKVEITKIEYESWHWRYVGEEHAKKMNELNMCLEEYIEYLQNGGTE